MDPTTAHERLGPPGVERPFAVQSTMNDFYARDAVSVARDLLGCALAHRLPDGSVLTGTIVETEAYREDDPASHSHRGVTDRTRVMFGPPAVAYVYFIYGMYDCFNVVCEPEGSGAAVLVRAVEPSGSWSELWRNRFGERSEPGWIDAMTPDPPRAIRELTSGPGRLCCALQIERALHNGMPIAGTLGDTTAGPPARADARCEQNVDTIAILHPDLADLSAERRKPGVDRPWLERWPLDTATIGVSRRIGITRAAEREWRFFVRGNPFVSRARPV